MHRLRLYLLGRCAAEVDGVAIPPAAWRRRRATDLLKLVALAPAQALPREQVMEALWPDADPELSANNLHRALYDLRQVLGGPFVHPDKGVIRMDDAWVDVDELVRLCAARDPESLAAAVALYRGDLSPDDPYSDSLEGPRIALRLKFADACTRLAAHRMAAGDRAGAAQVLRRLLEIDPDDEDAERALARALAPPPKRREESPAVRVARRLLGTAEPAPVRGRAADVAALAAFLESEHAVLLVTGEAGVGKTRLVVEGARAAAERGWLVLAGVALETQAGVPYGPFAEMWSDLTRAGASPADDPFAALLELSRDEPYAAQLRLFQAVERSLHGLAGERPPLLVVDDLHLADPSSLELVHYLARTRGLKLVATCRSEALRPSAPVQLLLGKLHRERLATRHKLDRLDAAASHEQLADLLGAERSAALAPGIFALCNGNPFLTEELAASQRDGQAGAPAVPEELAELVRERVAALGPDVEALLIAAAAAGSRFGFEEAAAAAGLPLERALDALERAQHDHLVEECGDGYRFRQTLTREAVYGALTRARRQHLHRKVGESLALQGAEPGRLAFQFRAGGDLSRALPQMLSACAAAERRGGLREAAAFLESALAAHDALGLPPDAARLDVVTRLARLRLALGDFEDAVRLFDSAVALAPDPGARAEALRGAGLALTVGGRLGEAGKRLDAALAALGEAAAGHAGMVALHHSRALLHWYQGQFAEAHGQAEASLRAAERHADRTGETRACEMLLLCSHGLGDWRAASAWEQRRSALAGPSFDVGELFDVHLCLWEMFLHDPAGWDRVRDMLAATEAEAQRTGTARILALCRCVGGTLASLEDRRPEAERALREAAEMYRRAGVPSGEAASLVRLGDLLTRSGRFEESRVLLHDALFVAERATMRSHVMVRLYAGMVRNHVALGSHEAAREALRDAAATEARWGRCQSCTRYLAEAAGAVSGREGAVEAIPG